ncbi:MAG: hypothetical protein HWQ38_20990 [Nostoc sp. NMS7]|uniref:DEAD/DEAH box helicase n=1 Tax=Nostoc sp. NMS7 TaxID=2815391 RepID=UPI0025DE912B|nr:ATP-binding protein [Nostoc sp. NMS7]MBN3948797.1 hypothetical protein [Nostoc sp. NMS7]
MKLFDLKFGKEVSGRFLLQRGAAQSDWEDKIVELQRIDEGILGFEAPNSNDSDLVIEVEPNSADAKVLMWELQSGQVSILGCIMKAAAQEVEIKGQAFTLPEAEIPVQLQVALTDEFIETVVMRQWSKVKTFQDAKRCLEREFLLDKFGYWFVNSGASDPDLERGFTVVGAKRALDLALSDDKQQLVAKRIVKHRGQNLDRRPIYLMRQSLEFCDKTAASTIYSAAIAALDKAVRENNSWIASWKHYNSEEGRILEERFGSLPPLRYQGRPKLKSDDSSKTLLIFNLELSANLKPWVEHISGDGLPIIIESDGGKPEGLAVDCDQKNKRLTVVWESDNEPPSNGIISPSMALEESKLKKRDNALKTLESARAGLPYLGLIFEGKTFERAIPRQKKIITKPARKMFGETGPTPDQEKALRIALSTPDIAVIQGPPGTGKTRVIQALLTMLNEGRNTNDGLETVLVTSLQHEAVDNAIAGMSLSGLPVDRLGGKKGEDRGAEVIQAWGDQVIKVVRSHLKNEHKATRTLIDQLKGSLSHWRTSAGGREGTREIILDFRNAAEQFLSAQQIAELDRLAATVPTVQTQPKPVIEDIEEKEELERRLNQQCTAEENFKDDGNRQARRLRRFLEPYLDNLSPDIIEAVEVAAAWTEENTAYREPWISLQNACIGIRQQLLEIPFAAPIAEQDVSDREIEQCLLAAIEEVKVARDQSVEGQQEALELFVRYLEEDPAHVREVIGKYSPIQATSCGQADSKYLGMANRTFNLVVVDEAARANPLDLLIPIVKGRRVILVGDHKQLPHVLEREIEQSLAKEGDEKLKDIYGKSLFERLWESLPKQTAIDGIERTAQLTDQFRMHPTIGQFVSDRFYPESPLNSSFVKPESRPNYTAQYNLKPIAWLDVPKSLGSETRAGNRSWQRAAEVDRIMCELRRVLPPIAEKYPNFDPSKPTGMVGVIAFYSAQEEAIKEAIADLRHGLPEHLQRRVRVGTVDAFQGREYDVVYLSTVRSNQEVSIEKRLGFTALPNRLCVAFSRARCVLIGVGDSACVASLRPDGTPYSNSLKAFVDLCRSEQGYADV